MSILHINEFGPVPTQTSFSEMDFLSSIIIITIFFLKISFRLLKIFPESVLLCIMFSGYSIVRHWVPTSQGWWWCVCGWGGGGLNPHDRIKTKTLSLRRGPMLSCYEPFCHYTFKTSRVGKCGNGFKILSSSERCMTLLERIIKSSYY